MLRSPLAPVIIALVVLATNAGGAAAAPCVLGPAGSGFATSYTYSPGSGACSFGGDDGEPMVAAVSSSIYAGSAMCGRYVRVTGPLGWVDVRIVDRCPACAAGDLALNGPAFALIANPALGRAAVTWQTIPSPLEGDVILYLPAGNTSSSLQIQPRDYRYGIAKLEYLGPSGYVTARPDTYDDFPAPASPPLPLPLPP